MSSSSPVAKYIIAAVVILGVPGAVVAYRLANPPAVTPITPVPSATTPKVSASRVELEVSSPTPGAEVSIAGEKHPLPWTGDLPSGNTETDIELTAPGHAGRRFKLVMDRPRRLVFALPTGSGVANASLEELDQALNSDDDLLALGPDAGEDAGARRAAALARRAAAAAAAASAAAATPTPTRTAVEPQPTAAVTHTAAPTPTETAAPTPTPTVTASAAPAVAAGTVDKKQVRAVIKAHSAEIQNCYDRAHMDTPDLRGQLTIEANVSAAGQVQSAQVSSTDIRSPRMESCILAAFKTWTFPAPAGGVPGTVTYSFVFKE